ncbi:MAG TPA: transcription-repair coupling factor, partial [Candidatus Jeotgalibaca merdavium]|nr:transcription-repair coupling factor [Candidatus Jeotgalibaca merdavium]
MKDIQAYLKRSTLLADLISQAREAGNQLVTGISGSARNLLTTMVYDELDGPIVVWAANLLQATQLYEDISQINPTIPTFLFPVEESLAVELAFSSPEYRSQRVEALHFLESGEKGIVVVPTAGFKKLLAPVSIWRNHVLTFDIGNEIDFEQLPEKLVAMGYERESMVASPGEFSVRGDIMDIYALNEEYPIRIEFFGSEVDRMRFFEPTTQKSFDEAVESVMVLPAQDTIFPPYILQEQVEEIEKKVKKAEKSIKNEDVKKRLAVFF